MQVPPLFKQKLIFDDVFVFVSRYLGVEVTERHYELEASISSKSKLAFEWHIGGPDGIRKEVVRSLCDNITKRGVPAPDCARRTQVSIAELDTLAQRTASRAEGPLRDKLGCDDVEVSCRYIGVVVPGGFDQNAPVNKQSRIAFRWTLQAQEWEWNEETAMRMKDMGPRDAPLPRCSVTRQRLADLAKEAAQNVSDKFSLVVSCKSRP